MSDPTASTYFLLDSQQGRNAEEGWRVQMSANLQIAPEGLRLAPLPSLPAPLKDDRGTLGGLTNPTGTVVDAQGVIYIADGTHHQIFKLTRREQLQVWVTFFRIDQEPFASDRFVYVPTANRLERWRPSRQPAPQSFDEVEVICETVWSEAQARQLIRSYIRTQEPESFSERCHPIPENRDWDKETIAETWEAPYPSHLPAGEICQSSIAYLPCLGGLGSAPRQFNEPRGLTISSNGDLYVADSKNHRIQIFSLPSLVLKAIWGKRARMADIQAPLPASAYLAFEAEQIRWGQPIAGDKPGEFNEPWDVVADRDSNIYIADTGNQRLQKYNCRTRKFKVIAGDILNAHFFQVLYGAHKDDRFVFIPARHRLERWVNALGGNPATAIISTTISTLEAARQLVLENLNAKGATDILVEWHTDYSLESDPKFDSPTHLAIDAQGRLYVVDRTNNYVKILDRDGRVLGQIDVPGQNPPTAIAIDPKNKLILANSTGLYCFDLKADRHYDGCCATWKGQCTSIAMDINGKPIAVGGDLGVAKISPPENFEKKGVYLSSPIDSDIYRCQWHKILLDAEIPTGASVTVWTYTSETELSSQDIQALQAQDWQTGQLNAKDFLILSPPGRFLWLKIELVGNKIDTPVLKHLKTYFPRLTYLQYLPAVYQADPVSKDFLERFLSIFETVLGSVESKIDRLAQYFDPDGVPDREFLVWLASWVDMIFYSGWSLETCRRLLRHAAELYRQRGTPAGLKQMLWLAFGVKAEILEHFCEQRWLFLGSSSLEGGLQLWGDRVLNRLQLGENARIGDFALVGTSDPTLDPFSAYAHRFSVFISAAQLRSLATERQIRALIEAEKPAHTQYTLNKVEPRFRVGVQSTVGMDTLVGTYPRMVLNHCSTLGYDAVLGSAPEVAGGRMQVGRRTQVGVNTVLV